MYKKRISITITLILITEDPAIKIIGKEIIINVIKKSNLFL